MEFYSINDSENEFTFKSRNINSFRAHEAKTQYDRSSIRFHYTSANALLSILNTYDKGYGSVRFTDSRYMNDRSEHLFFVKRLLEFLDEHKNDFSFCLEVVNDLFLKNHTMEEYVSLQVAELEEAEIDIFSFTKSRKYLFCLSKEDDSLHMWNYYIRNGNYQGYNIGIRVYEFLKNFDNDNNDRKDPIKFYCGNVLYKKKEQDKEIEELCKTIEKYELKYGGVEHYKQIAMMHLWIYTECYGLFYKDESFSDENEYRIVLQFEEHLAGVSVAEYFKNSNSDIKYIFFERNGVLVPCLSVPLAKSAVEQITMAPILEKHIASESVKEFLESNNYNGVEVKQSGIPIRY